MNGALLQLLAAAFTERDRLRALQLRLAGTLAAALLFATAGGFLVAALYLLLEAALGAPFAALLTGVLLLLLGTILALAIRRGTPKGGLAGLEPQALIGELVRRHPREALLLALLAGALFEWRGRRGDR